MAYFEYSGALEQASSINLGGNDLKRFLKKGISNGYTKSAGFESDLTWTIGISKSDVNGNLDKILFAEITEVLKRASKQVAISGEKVTTDTIDMLVDVLTSRIDNTLRAIADIENHDDYSCSFCWELIYDPLTLQCGHTYCKKCVPKLWHCKICKSKIDKNTHISSNIGLTSILEKVHSMEYVGRSISAKGEELMHAKQYQNAIEKYLDAMDFVPHIRSALLNRAKAFNELGNLEGAVQDVKGVKTFTRNTSEAHFIKGEILLKSKNEDEALVSFLSSLAVDSSNIGALNSSKKLIKGILSRGRIDDDFPQKAKQKKSEVFEELSYSTKNTECVFTTLIRDLELSLLNDVNLARCLVLKEKEIKDAYSIRTPDKTNVDSRDFECSLCMRIYLEPVCTPCGHLYCRDCIERWLDHGTECPLCKRKISVNVIDQKLASPNVDVVTKSVMQQVLYSEYQDRLNQHNEETRYLKLSTPILVCKLALPSIPCPLHIFEPRYRLLLRRALDIHNKQFGICVPSETDPFHSYGTSIRIRDVQFFPDGRSVVESVGTRRFCVLSHGKADGYDTSVIEYLEDKQPEKEEDNIILQKLLTLVYNNAKEWFKTVKPPARNLIIKHFGDFPSKDTQVGDDGPKWHWWVLSVLPVEEKVKVNIFSRTLLKERLIGVHRILACLAKKAAQLNFNNINPQ